MRGEELRKAISRIALFETARSSGPGGQNVNKSNTKVILRIPVEEIPLSEESRALLFTRLENRINGERELVIHASETRSQATNRERALSRAVSLIESATRRQKRRRPTRPSQAARRRRVESKRRQGEKKRLRRDPDGSA